MPLILIIDKVIVTNHHVEKNISQDSGQKCRSAEILLYRNNMINQSSTGKKIVQEEATVQYSLTGMSEKAIT
jgi:hypothetical protein